ncbi:T-cell immunoglobulin and mucin domain-containing protein 4, partial [Corvus brachyrhynchos]
HTVSENVVKGIIGQAVTLPCSYQVTRREDITDMCWGRGPCPSSKCRNKILHTTGTKVTFKVSQRYNLHGSLHVGDVSLTIRTAQAEDAGIYCCRVEIPGLFNDIKRNIRLEVARAPPVTTTTTMGQAPVSAEHFTETTFAPQTTSDLQPTPEPAVLLTTSTSAPATTATESPAVTTWETSAPPTIAVTEDFIFPVTTVETSAPPDFPTTSQAADVTTEDDMLCFTLPGMTTEFPVTFPTAEETTTSVMMEEDSVMEQHCRLQPSALSHQYSPSCANSSEANLLLKPFHFLSSPFQFPSSAILIACVIAGSILLVLMISLVVKRKHTKKFIIKSAGPPEEAEKVFSGAEGENNVFSL